MFSGLSNYLKKILPKRLFYRALLIVAVPVITLQLIITIVFFDSLWIKTNKGMTRTLVNEISTFIEAYDSEENNKEESKCFHSIENYSDFVSLYRRLKFPIKRYHYNRFRNGDLFYCLLEDNYLYCSGWSTSKDIYVSEVDKTFKVDGKIILYDYHTPEKFRRKGMYQELLESIISYLNSDIFIYALTNNIASNRAIQKVGFQKSTEDQLK